MPVRKQTYDSPRQLARRASILEATRDLLSKHGYDGTTVRDVAELAGVAKGTLYNIYGGKDELIFAAVNDVRADVFDRTMDLGPSPGIDIILKSNEAVCEEVVRTPLYTEAISRALFGPSPAKMLIPSLVEFPINRTRDELDMAILLGQIEKFRRQGYIVLLAWGGANFFYSIAEKLIDQLLCFLGGLLWGFFGSWWVRGRISSRGSSGRLFFGRNWRRSGIVLPVSKPGQERRCRDQYE